MVIDHFRVIEQLGKGGMGTVFLAEDINLGRIVALKVLSPALLEEEGYRERFYREARHAARLSHPNIVSIFHLGEAGGSPYFAMEFVRGTPLDEILQDQGALPPEQAVQLVLQALEGLQHAHGHGIIHRDMKPANLVLGADKRLRILDFGLARAADTTGLTRSGAIMGTPDFMAPEQGLGKKVEHTGDIYAVGVILFQFLTGQLPFSGDSALEVMMAHVQNPPPDLTQLCPELPDKLCAVISRCLEKAPEDRYQNYPHLIKDLQACLPGLRGLPAKTLSKDFSDLVNAETIVDPAGSTSAATHVPAQSVVTKEDGNATLAPTPPPKTPLPEPSLSPPAASPPQIPWPWARRDLAAPSSPYPLTAANPLRYLSAFWAHPFLARQEMLRRLPAPTVSLVWSHMLRISLAFIVCNLLFAGPIVFGSVIEHFVCVFLILTPGAWLFSRLRGGRLGFLSLFLLWTWAFTPMILAHVPLLNVLAGILLVSQLLAQCHLILTTTAPPTIPPEEVPEAVAV
jgi:serine/threonine protein kinase